MNFLAKLNELNPWAIDISSTYLETEMKEKVGITAILEFGKLRGMYASHSQHICTDCVHLDAAGTNERITN